ncbi:hypothetical protein [Castellaniella sp.]|uniref:hypothetical protein n=1 Tax=Castellaniella sp. TaxID=1955812 RepID=UPI002AFEF2A6|nr:hypothetical protein [Castellaniella sp.]
MNKYIKFSLVVLSMALIALPIVSAFVYSFAGIELWMPAENGSTRELGILLFHVVTPVFGSYLFVEVQSK